jgi:hypothetical protein
MAYDDPILPSSKAVLRAYNEAAIRHFKLARVPAGQAESALTVHPPSLIPWVVKRLQQDTYHKKTAPPPAAEFLECIEKNGLLDSFVWRTDARRLKQAVRFGIVKTQSLTSRVIGTLGHYRLIQLQRIQEGFISNRYQLKEKLLNHYQDYFEALEALESLVNQSPTLEQFNQALAQYMGYLKKTEAELTQHAALSSLEKHIHSKLQRDIIQAQRCAEKFREAYLKHPTDRATGTASILTFVKERMIRALREMQNLNQDITYSRKLRFALTRGELNSYIEDAEKIIEDYRAPPRDAIYAEHHGVYGADETPVVYDSAMHCSTEKALSRAVLAVHFIEGKNVLDLSDPAHPHCYVNGTKYPLVIAKGTVWYMIGGFTMGAKRVATWFLNVLIKLAAGPIELLFTLVIEPMTVNYFPQFFEGVRRLATFEVPIHNPYAPALAGEEILSRIDQSRISLGLRLRGLLRNVFRNAIKDLVYGASDIFKALTIRLFDALRDDYAAGEDVMSWQEVSVASDTELQQIQQYIEAIQKHLSLEKLEKKEQAFFAAPPFMPSVGEYDDLLNAAASGSDAFVNIFTHNIHAKHPFVGLIYTLLYLSTAGAVLYPHLVLFLGKPFILFTEQLAGSMAKSKISGAVGAAVFMAQGGAFTADLMINGRYSALVSSAQAFEKDPFTALLYAGAALGLGYLFVYGFNMPGLSEDIGSFPPNSLIFVGAKLSFLVYELLKEAHSPLSSDETVRFESFTQAQTAFNEKMATADPKLKEKIALLVFMMQNHAQLRYLSPQTKSRCLLLLKCHFSKEEVASLEQWFYPEDVASIARRTLKIIFYYPAALVRFGVACGSSFWLGNMKPIQRVVDELGMTVIKDLTRVGRAASQGSKIFVAFIRRHLKVVGDVFCNSGLARSEALLAGTHHIAGTNYQVSAALDIAYERARQSTPFLDAGIRHVTPANPLHLIPTLNKQGFFGAPSGETLQPVSNSSKNSPVVVVPPSSLNFGSAA